MFPSRLRCDKRLRWRCKHIVLVLHVQRHPLWSEQQQQQQRETNTNKKWENTRWNEYTQTAGGDFEFSKQFESIAFHFSRLPVKLIVICSILFSVFFYRSTIANASNFYSRLSHFAHKCFSIHFSHFNWNIIIHSLRKIWYGSYQWQ